MLKALSLHQPWAQAMAMDWKRVETRGKRTSHRGELAIQAAKHWDQDAADWWDWLTIGGFPEIPPLGAIVAVVDIFDIRRTELLAEELAKSELDWGNYGPGRWGWITENVRRLADPVPCRGYQAIWTLPDDVEAKVRAQL